jgi:hypothetical protein
MRTNRECRHIDVDHVRRKSQSGVSLPQTLGQAIPLASLLQTDTTQAEPRFRFGSEALSRHQREDSDQVHTAAASHDESRSRGGSFASAFVQNLGGSTVCHMHLPIE